MLGLFCLAAGTGAASAQAPQRPMPTLPLTQLDERGQAADLDNRTFSLTFAQPVPIKDLLILLVRGTSLSVVPDPAIAGSFIGELKNVTVRQALGLILRPLGLDYALDAGVIRVFRREPETRIFDLDYIATQRTASTTIGAESGKSAASVSSASKSDLFEELAAGVKALLSERAAFNVDRKAGLLQATDFTERLDRVSTYLDAVQDRVQRQVQIEARVIEVELNDEKATGINWTAAAAPASAPGDRAAPPRRALTALRITDAARLLDRLAAQGKVVTVAAPRLLTLNNEPAIVRTAALTLSITPQIASDSALTLDVAPMLETPAAIESDMLARVADGETLVLSGFTRDRETRERKHVGISGGWFGRATVVTRTRVELVVLITPTIVVGGTAP